METVTINLKVNRFVSRVLGVIKNKYGLKDMSEALNKFCDIYGEEFAEREVKDELVREMIDSCEEHLQKHGLKSMSLKEFDKFCEAI